MLIVKLKIKNNLLIMIWIFSIIIILYWNKLNKIITTILQNYNLNLIAYNQMLCVEK